jgi:hypothetical protein
VGPSSLSSQTQLPNRLESVVKLVQINVGHTRPLGGPFVLLLCGVLQDRVRKLGGKFVPSFEHFDA